MSNIFERHPKISLSLFLLLAFIVIDLLAGTIYNSPIYNVKNAYYHHGLRKNFKGWVFWGYGKNLLYTNSLGFKDRCNRRISPATDKYRIVFIGDSFVEGAGYPYDATFVGIIDKKLGRKKFEVLNAGVGSYSPKLYYYKIKYLIEELHLAFNELYVYIDISDIQDEVDYKTMKPETPENELWSEISLFLRGHSFYYRHLYDLRRALVKKQEIKKFLRWVKENPEELLWTDDRDHDRERAQWTVDEKILERWGKEGLDLADVWMDRLYLLCKNNGIKFSIAVYPWPYQIEHNDLASRQVIFWHKFCLERNMAFINYFPAFINDADPKLIMARYFLKGDFHWNAQGHNLIAQKWLESFSKGYEH
jgi:hypothetical protein